MEELKKYNHPTAFVIFGGTGNLAQTKLLPALFDLYVKGVLPQVFTIVGLARKELSDEAYRAFAKLSIDAMKHRHDEGAVAAFCSHLQYRAGSFDDPETYERVKKTLLDFDESAGQCTSKLFYIAVPPTLYSEIFFKLKESNAMALCSGADSWSRLLVEKPFGNNLMTAQMLERQLQELFMEEQIYRIDHYLAKDAIENIISLRFANSIFAASWNNTCIESIAVRLLEKNDAATRGSFYDGIGALRDVGQNHMLQILTLLTMNAVDVHDVTSVRAGRVAALQSFSFQKPTTLVRGQYAGYTATPGVDPASETETYFFIETEIKNKQWEGVRVSLESGKAMNRSVAEAVITFRAVDSCACGAVNGGEPHEHKDELFVTFSPEQHMRLIVWVKKPGFTFMLEKRELELTRNEGADPHSPEAYERVLYDCIVGDQTRFVSGDEELAAWEFITPILEMFKTLPLRVYNAGSEKV